MTKKIKQKGDSSFFSTPVVSILGHVDHGKTSLLDKIRQSKITEKEFGGITQHIGTYQITLAGNKKITFIDTPGHEAFAKMRSRGAEVCDIAILVVAANDGVMPQTKESIEHILHAKIPYIVACTKIDLVDASVDKIKKQLLKNGVLIDEYGGAVPVVPVSSKTGQGIDKLLEMILLVSEMHEVKKDPSSAFEGVIIETKLDKARGNVATIIVKNGTITQRDNIITKDGIEGKVRAMFDENGHMVKTADPGKGVELLGLSSLPSVGISIYKKEETAIGIAPPTKIVAASPPGRLAVSSPSEIVSEKLKIVLKADTSGSLEAILASLKENVEIMSASTGAIGESDVIFAKSSGAIIIGFNVKPSLSVVKLATSEKVMIKTYTIIYEMLSEIDEVSEALRTGGLEEVSGEAKILVQFDIKGEKIAGVKIISGRIAKGDKVKVVRGTTEIGRSRIKSLRHQKEEITKAEQGTEAGVVLTQKLDFLINDVIISIG